MSRCGRTPNELNSLPRTAHHRRRPLQSKRLVMNETAVTRPRRYGGLTHLLLLRLLLEASACYSFGRISVASTHRRSMATIWMTSPARLGQVGSSPFRARSCTLGAHGKSPHYSLLGSRCSAGCRPVPSVLGHKAPQFALNQRTPVGNRCFICGPAQRAERWYTKPTAASGSASADTERARRYRRRLGPTTSASLQRTA